MKALNIRLPDSLHAALKDRAASQERSLAWVINKALEEAVGLQIGGAPVVAKTQRKVGVRKSTDSPAAKFPPGPVPPRARVVDGVASAGDETHRPERCTHPEARVLRGQCQACGERVS
jgi:plasmid stability protein